MYVCIGGRMNKWMVGLTRNELRWNKLVLWLGIVSIVRLITTVFFFTHTKLLNVCYDFISLFFISEYCEYLYDEVKKKAKNKGSHHFYATEIVFHKSDEEKKMKKMSNNNNSLVLSFSNMWDVIKREKY